jgi:hypothetical protein
MEPRHHKGAESTSPRHGLRHRVRITVPRLSRRRGDTSLGLWQQSLAPARNAFADKLRECTSASFAC